MLKIYADPSGFQSVKGRAFLLEKNQKVFLAQENLGIISRKPENKQGRSFASPLMEQKNISADIISFSG